jgi:HD-GYP domain-containing protein (c-di-GMP phosphodiesterase class II)
MKVENIGFVSTRFAGIDGVSLEASKWEEVFEQRGHRCFWFAGKLDQNPEKSSLNRYSELLARLFEAENKFIEDISEFAQLHDIGKINVAEIIKLPRKLTSDEFNFMKKHTTYGAEMVAGLDGLEMAYYMALEHHEKWDGSGYPKGKKKDDISLEARIVAIADVFDALVSARPYKDAFDYKKTFEIFKKGDGRVMPSHFDPELLHLFLEHYDEFVELHKQLED